ncbi:hypothetical protein TNCV_3356271 [Trichonephila clavipes]|nr:hypothetical protein TNCV_3356271 [Trichonephila clavipes]
MSPYGHDGSSIPVSQTKHSQSLQRKKQFMVLPQYVLRENVLTDWKWQPSKDRLKERKRKLVFHRALSLAETRNNLENFAGEESNV